MPERTPEERAIRAKSFDSDPAQYDRARPKYPAEVFDELWRLAELSDHPRIVEVGCGTGQSTLDLARRGGQITCVEFGPNMAALARENLSDFPDVNFEISKFEEWDPGELRFDLVFASASWHWIDPDVRYGKAASVLGAGGHLAILGSGHVFPTGYDPRYDAMQEVYREVTGSTQAWPPKPPEEMPDNADELEKSGFFEDVHVARHLWYFDRTADEYIELLGSYSDNRIRDPEQRAQLFAGIHRIISAAPGGIIRKHYLSILRVGRVRAN